VGPDVASLAAKTWLGAGAGTRQCKPVFEPASLHFEFRLGERPDLLLLLDKGVLGFYPGRLPRMRLTGYSFLFLLFISNFCSADLKIKTRTTVMGHSTESTVYIKGSRERTEMSFGGHGASVTLLQCDQKRMVTLMGDHCNVTPFGGNETSCPAAPDSRAMGKDMDAGDAGASRKGGVVTISRSSTDTGERQEMFGYKARHIKSSMMMESTPDACNQSNMKIEIDGWYADLANFSCGEESYRSMACGGMGGKRGCSDRIVMKGSGTPLGYPLKQTMTMTMPQGTFTTTVEVIELTKTTLDAPLFDAPPSCRVTNTPDAGATTSAAESGSSTASPAAATAAPQPAAAPAPSAPPKAAGILRVGVVPIKDSTGQSLPTDSLQLGLLSEFARNQIDTVLLSADSPLKDVESEARAKQCDYFVFTVPTLLKDPNTGGLTATSMPKGAKLDQANYQALTLVTLYKVGKPAPELKDVPFAADANKFGVDAVSATFAQESDKVAQQLAEDAHPKAAPKSAHSAARPAATKKQ
jgi:hypothetical protein